MLIRGFAAPFGSIGKVGRDLECFAPYAFDLSGPSIDIRAGHDGNPFGSTAEGSLHLFQNDYGLAYEARLPVSGDVWGWLPDLRRGELGVSVNLVGLHPRDEKTDVIEGVTTTTIFRARIDHIALLHQPVYSETSAWFSHWDDADLPPRLQIEACRWRQKGTPPASPRKVQSAAGFPILRRNHQMVAGDPLLRQSSGR